MSAQDDDTRDIWEKIADPYLVGGAIGGAALGRMAGRRMAKGLRKDRASALEEAEFNRGLSRESDEAMEDIDAYNRSMGYRGSDRRTESEMEWQGRDARGEERAFRRLANKAGRAISNVKNLGTAAGVAAGYATGGAVSQKRRKK